MRHVRRISSVKPAHLLIGGRRVLCYVTVELVDFEIIPTEKGPDVYGIERVDVVIQQQEAPFTVFALRKNGQETNVHLLDQVGPLVAQVFAETVAIVMSGN